MKHTYFWLACLLLTTIYVPQSAAGGGEEPRAPAADSYATKIIWADEAQEHPVFLPQGVLQGADVDQLPLDRHAKSFLRDEIKLRKQFGGHCSEPRYSSEQGAAQNTFDLPGLLQTAKASFVGTITDMQSGWIVARRLVGELAYIEITEVLVGKDRAATPSKGKVVGVLFAGGTTIISDTTFCQKPTSGFFRPAVGDTVLVGGAMSSRDPSYFYVSFVLPVVNDQVLAQPLSELAEDVVSTPLGNLRNEIKQEMRQ